MIRYSILIPERDAGAKLPANCRALRLFDRLGIRTKFCASTMVQAPRRKASCSRCCPGSPRCGCGGSLLRRAQRRAIGRHRGGAGRDRLGHQGWRAACRGTYSATPLSVVSIGSGLRPSAARRLAKIPASTDENSTIAGVRSGSSPAGAAILGGPTRSDCRNQPGSRNAAILALAGGARGFRVGDMVVEDTASGPPIRDAWPNPWNLFAAWWACRRWSDNATGRIAVHEPSAADADRAADEFLLVDPRAPAALRAGASRSIPRVSSGRRRRTSVTTPPTPCPLLFTRRPHEDIFFGRRAQRRPARGQFDPQLAAASSRRGVRRLRRTADGRGRLRFARRSDGPGRDVDPARAVEPAQISGVGQPGRSLFSPSAARTRSC